MSPQSAALSTRTDVLRRAAEAPSARTLRDVLTATVARHPDAIALDDGDQRLTYLELHRRLSAQAAVLAGHGIGPGERVGLRLPSGSNDLYVAILAVLWAGAAYVPVDADDPDERASLVFDEADVCAVLTPEGVDVRRPGRGRSAAPGPDDDAWVIFTSGSTGTPKAVAITHRSAAAFVDAEAGLFLADRPLGPGDRVLAGLSVGFDASCEEMWLAWRHGACLVPAPRALVRSGADLGGWLRERRISAVSTVPTLAAMWPADALSDVRLLIFGGEACPAELAARLAAPGREVWNTYGPTETTVVACAALLDGSDPVPIGLPLAGWDLAVVGPDGQPVAPGAPGELVIGGVGLGRYLDPELDAAKFAPALGWPRAYRSGDLVRQDAAGLVFLGRADDQVKVGGRRIELGEIDAALLSADGVHAAAATVQTSRTGTRLLVGYVVPAAGYRREAALDHLSRTLPRPLVPLLAEVDDLPMRSSGKVDRDALPWPLPEQDRPVDLPGTAGWLAERWTDVIGVPVTDLDDDFFAIGGSSLAAAHLVTNLRLSYPDLAVSDIYKNPTLAGLAAFLDLAQRPPSVPGRTVRPVPRRAGVVQLGVSLLAATLTGLRWLTVLGLLAHVVALPGAPVVPWPWVAAGLLAFCTPFGRMALSAAAARALLLGLRPGRYPRGGHVHLRIWAAERVADAVDATGLAGTPWMVYYARALGARIGRDVDLHTVPPITGMLRLGRGCSVEPEADLSGYWIDGDVVHVGPISIGRGAVVGARSTLAPGSRIGPYAHVAAGSAVDGEVAAGAAVEGSPARPTSLPTAAPLEPAPRPRRWFFGYAATAVVLGLLPYLAAVPSVLLLDRIGPSVPRILLAVPALALLWFVTLAVVTTAVIRALGAGLRGGYHPVRSRVAWQVWATERTLDTARTLLFPLYSSLFTPVWLRLLGAQIGRGVEASTVLLLPRMTTVGDGAFLADDTMVGSYELAHGYLRIDRTKIGKRAFLGNSGMTGPGRSVPKDGLVAVLSTAPVRAKKGSSWLGSPPVRLRRRADKADRARTFAPPLRLRVARAGVELCRAVPMVLSAGVLVGVLLTLDLLVNTGGIGVAAALSGVVLFGAGVASAAVTVLAKWLLVGRVRARSYPLWSSFVWRNELLDSFVEVLAAPWFAWPASGTPAMAAWQRALGARIGPGVWCESYWLPEPDLVRIGSGATVNRGCVLQTHLFHDRILRLGPVQLGAGATLGPHGVILPAAAIGPAAVVGPASLLMRGEDVPAGSRWQGNPVAPWFEAEAGCRT